MVNPDVVSCRKIIDNTEPINCNFEWKMNKKRQYGSKLPSILASNVIADYFKHMKWKIITFSHTKSILAYSGDIS